MPDLPTITVTAAQAQRLLAAFGDQASYRKWLRLALVDEVERREVRAHREAANQTVHDGMADLRTVLGPVATADEGAA